MKIAITADLHLTTQKKNPDRFHALQAILERLVQSAVRVLILAGDTFDESSRNYAEFERVCQQPEFRHIRLLLIPGNHDHDLDANALAAENVEVITEGRTEMFSRDGLPFLLLPYVPAKTMGEEIARHAGGLPTNRWVLVGHGDWTAGMHEPDPVEPGTYMPLTRVDIEKFKPRLVVLGHIHKPTDSNRVIYPGSPCGLDIRETGRRRFVLIDADSGDVQLQAVTSDFIYFNEAFVVVPGEHELEYVTGQIEKCIGNWSLADSEIDKVRIQVKFSGYTSNKRALLDTVQQSLQKFHFYKDGEPDLSEVFVADDPNRAEIARRVSERIERMNLAPFHRPPTKAAILLQALHAIYGE
ncbi:MAG: exonuclease SbcCD subunit D [bacterium]